MLRRTKKREKEKKVMSASSCATMTTMWSLFGQLTHIHTTALLFFSSPFPSTHSFREMRGMVLWNMLTQANEKGGGRKGLERERKRESKRLWRAVEEIQQLQQFSIGVWKELLCSSPLERLWSHDHQATLFRGVYRSFQHFVKRGVVFLPGFPNMLHRLNTRLTACQMYFPH